MIAKAKPKEEKAGKKTKKNKKAPQRSQPKRQSNGNKPKKEDAVRQENAKLIPEIKGNGFDMMYMGDGVYIYQEGKWEEKIDREKIKKIKRRIVDKVFKATPVEALQFAYNGNLICEKLFE